LIFTYSWTVSRDGRLFIAVSTRFLIQFLWQEPGTDAEIKAHVQSTYGVKFPLFAKSDVNGDNTNAAYVFLKQAFPGDIGWNFGGNFLVDRDGRVVRRYEFKELDKIEAELLPLLEKPASS
jgi:glutathione peroxidase-family protein